MPCKSYTHNKDERFWQLPQDPKLLLAFGPHSKNNIVSTDTEYQAFLLQSMPLLW